MSISKSDYFNQILKKSGELAQKKSIGYYFILLLMILENTIILIPFDLVLLPLAGYYIGQNILRFNLVVLFATLGSLIGSLLMYILGMLINKESIKLIIPYSSTKSLFYINLFSRLVPGIRKIISIYLGAKLLNINLFLISTIIGSFIWTSLLTISGIVLQENHYKIKNFKKHYTKIVLLILFIGLFLALYIRKFLAALS